MDLFIDVDIYRINYNKRESGILKKIILIWWGGRGRGISPTKLEIHRLRAVGFVWHALSLFTSYPITNKQML